MNIFEKYTLDILNNFLQQVVDDSYTLKYRSFAHRQLKNYDKALSDINTAINLDSDNPDLYYARGVIKYLLEDFDGAIADASEAIKIDPSYEEYYRNRAMAYYAKKDYSEAGKDFNKILSLNPGNQFAQDALNEMNIQIEPQQDKNVQNGPNYIRSILSMRQSENVKYVEQQDDRNEELHYISFNIKKYVSSKEDELFEAMKNFATLTGLDQKELIVDVLGRDPYISVYAADMLAVKEDSLWITDMLMKMKNLVKPINVATCLIEIDFYEEDYEQRRMYSLNSNNNLVTTTYTETDEEAAKTAIEEGRANYWAEKGNLFGKNYPLKGVEMYTKALSLDPYAATYYFKRAQLKSFANDRNGVIADYNKAIELNPKYYNVYYERAATHEQAGNYEKAIADYNKALEIYTVDADDVNAAIVKCKNFMK